MNRSRSFPIVVVVRGVRLTSDNLGEDVDIFLSGMCDGQLFWDDDKDMALRFSSATAASLVADRIAGAKPRVAFA